jgi:hypothetical protein
MKLVRIQKKYDVGVTGVSDTIKKAVSESQSEEIAEWHTMLAEVFTVLQV